MEQETLRKRWGRRKGRPLNMTRQEAMDNVLSRYGLDIAHIENSRPQSQNPQSFFENHLKEIWLEIGFGNGEHVIGIAKANPDVGIIGCEPFVNGVSALCKMIEEQDITNIRIWPDDAHVLMNRLSPDSIDTCFVLFPDPWPKLRHHKRRFIRKENMDVLSGLIKSQGILHLATDHPDLAEWMLEQGITHSDFEWLAESCEDWQKEPDEWVKTRYQVKALEQGRKSFFMNFKRK